jgi:hypothetical protein
VLTHPLCLLLLAVPLLLLLAYQQQMRLDGGLVAGQVAGEGPDALGQVAAAPAVAD